MSQLDQLIQGLKRDINDHTTQIIGLKGLNKTFDKCFAEIANMEAFIRMEIQKQKDEIEHMKHDVQQQELQNMAMEKTHKAEMLSVIKCEKKTEQCMEQL